MKQNKSKFLFLSLAILIFASCFCLASNKTTTSAYDLNTHIDDITQEKSYLAKRGVMGVTKSGITYTYPFFTASGGKTVYCIDSDFTAQPFSAIWSNESTQTLDATVHKFLSSNIPYFNQSNTNLFNGSSFKSGLISYLQTTYSTDYVEFTDEDFRYATQIAVHLIAGHFSESDLVKVDTYYASASDGYLPSHTDLTPEQATVLFNEMKAAVLSMKSSLAASEHSLQSSYFTAPSQTGDGLTVTLPASVTSTTNVVVLPIDASANTIVLNEGSNYTSQQWILTHGQSATSASLLLNNLEIPGPTGSSISSIKICNNSGALENDTATFDNTTHVFTSTASYLKITIDDPATYNAWIAANPNASFDISTSDLDLYYVDNTESYVNVNRSSGGAHIQEMFYPTYKKVTIKPFKLKTPSISNVVSIKKVIKGTSTPVKDVVIELRDSSDALVTQNNDGDNLVLTSNADGLITLVNLAPGTYKYKETSAPSPYYLNNNTYTFTISATGEVTGTLLFENIKGPDVVITKTDSFYTSEGVAGAIYNFKKDGASFATKTTNASGKITLQGLQPGTYTYQEITAPAGYIKDENVYTFTVSELGQVSGTVNVSDVHYAITFEKKDKSSSLLLTGAKFEFFTNTGTSLGTATSNANGKVHFEVSAPGTYKVKEIQPPAGYQIETADYIFTVNNDNSMSGPSTVYNVRKVSPYTPPVTGD